MRRCFIRLAVVLAPLLLGASPVAAEPLIWGVQAEQLEYRANENKDMLAWDFDAIVGTDELKLVWRSEGEYGLDEDLFETLENQARVQVLISTFFDAVGGVHVETPDNQPDRIHGVVGIKWLVPQWFEVDVDLFISDKSFLRLEGEYEVLITNWMSLTPVVELELPFTDDPATGVSAWGPKLESGIRFSYDLVDRLGSPYIGIHYKKIFSESADLRRNDRQDVDTVFFTAGTRILF